MGPSFWISPVMLISNWLFFSIIIINLMGIYISPDVTLFREHSYLYYCQRRSLVLFRTTTTPTFLVMHFLFFFII
ncbi:hypothetical protein BDB00DRAFT_836561 [Zychaea mexicana]|uniref:uncharacterized protein n=1 Tax=Zychaea mexicana TaxID=64656 RepID=UPI0022FE8D71|nr:uncharacterized protein BDB00DRAFT_836561 [Zychaea mexicana]KAI9490743.1 hypothetical protein BDB00DRAFT_836561 [Zychaea mexicana]